MESGARNADISDAFDLLWREFGGGGEVNFRKEDSGYIISLSSLSINMLAKFNFLTASDLDKV